jgi:hypothetical protein
MRTGLAVSTLAHASLILLAITGLSLSKPLEPAPEESIAVDLVPVDAFSNIRMGSLDSTVVETETPAVVESEKPAELAQPTGNTQDDQPTPEDAETPTPAPTKETAPAPAPAEPVVAPEPEPAPEPPPVETAEVPEPVAAPEPAPEPVMPAPPLATPQEAPDPADAAPVPIVRTASLAEKRAAYKKAVEAQKAAEAALKKKQADEAAAKKKAEQQQKVQVATRDDKAAKAAEDISDIINSEQSRGATTGEGGKPTLGRQDGRSATLTQSETAGLIAQMRGCWNLLPSEIEANLSVRLLVSLAPDGTVTGSPQILEQDSSPMGISIARAAVMAVRKCGPYRLDVAKYDAWQQVDVTFRPSDL